MINIHTMSIKSALLILGLSLSTQLWALAPSETRWQTFTHAAISEHIVPRYKALAHASVMLNTRISEFCKHRSPEALVETKHQFKMSLKAWQGIQHIQFGPVILLMRNFSLQYWPDKKNLGSRQLNALLKTSLTAGNYNYYNPEFFARASVAVKGLPAIERLLFDPEYLEQLGTNPNYCLLLSGIGGYIAQNTQAIVNEWQREMDNYQDFSEDGVYLSAQEAATEILKALVEPVEAISDAKIGLPLGDTLAKMRWRKSESWRSGQSIANIRVNFAALQHLYSGIEAVNVRMLLAEVGANSLADIIDQQFKQLVRLLENVKEPESMQYQQSDYDKLQMVQPSLKMLSDSLLASMRLLQINLGFNRRDGD